ncbi:hypothetical protein [Wocania ichthyoenteri]|uniref:hypothetical protein n=1 Tax=Wocania ichthyoenteri TaxID=1230531 RepID=UPI00053F1756|nr:hypothetical protein [Wocania ichthyoenteri]
MKDELRKYTAKHEGKFDDYDLDEVDKLRLWSDIVSELPEAPKKVIPLWSKPAFRVAASVLLLLGCTLFFYISGHINTEHQIANEELYEIDNHYKLLVNNQIDLIKNNANLSKEDQDDFLSLIDDLDNEYKKLKEELKLGINNEKIIEAIISNYRKKIQLMEDLLKRSYPIKTDFEDEAIIL